MFWLWADVWLLQEASPEFQVGNIEVKTTDALTVCTKTLIFVKTKECSMVIKVVVVVKFSHLSSIDT